MKVLYADVIENITKDGVSLEKSKKFLREARKREIFGGEKWLVILKRARMEAAKSEEVSL